MKALILLVLCLYFTGCKESGSDAKADASPSLVDPRYDDPDNPNIDTSSYTYDGEYLEEMTDGYFVKGGSAHPTNGGDVIKIVGNTYKRTFWLSGDQLTEDGTISYEEIKTFDHFYEKIILRHKIVFNPTSYNPGNCGYSLDSYKEDYDWMRNGPIAVQHAIIGLDTLTMAVGWPDNVKPENIEINLNGACL